LRGNDRCETSKKGEIHIIKQIYDGISIAPKQQSYFQNVYSISNIMCCFKGETAAKNTTNPKIWLQFYHKIRRARLYSKNQPAGAGEELGSQTGRMGEDITLGRELRRNKCAVNRQIIHASHLPQRKPQKSATLDLAAIHSTTTPR
jgi:hypothetical protein